MGNELRVAILCEAAFVKSSVHFRLREMYFVPDFWRDGLGDDKNSDYSSIGPNLNFR